MTSSRTARGMALAFALVLFPILLTLGLAFMSMAGVDYGFSGHAATRIRAFYLADSGARYAISERARLRTPWRDTLALSTGEVRVSVEPYNGPQGYDTTSVVTAVGHSGWATVRVQARVQWDGSILTWDEQGATW